ncbi:MAG TPA: hypothetical protein VNS52_01245 [Gemmatimonadaceae bacterium]|nr:hypothetical protein [Gemmatimonadaceae bacterium]
MKRSTALGMAVVGGALALRSISPARRPRLGAAMRRRMLGGMEQMMASMPEDAPPKLIMSVLPRLRDQNDEMIAMLREQNELLRQQLNAARGAAPA